MGFTTTTLSLKQSIHGNGNNGNFDNYGNFINYDNYCNYRNYGNYCNLPKYHTVADDHAAHGKNSVHKEYEHHIHLKGRVASSQLNLSIRRRVGTAIIFFSDAEKVKLSHEFDKYRLCLFGEKQTL